MALPGFHPPDPGVASVVGSNADFPGLVWPAGAVPVLPIAHITIDALTGAVTDAAGLPAISGLADVSTMPFNGFTPNAGTVADATGLPAISGLADVSTMPFIGFTPNTATAPGIVIDSRVDEHIIKLMGALTPTAHIVYHG